MVPPIVRAIERLLTPLVAVALESFFYGFGFVGMILFIMQAVAPGRFQTAHEFQNAVAQWMMTAAPDGVILEIEGQYEALHCSGAPERLIYSAIPQGLMATPTLSVLVEAPQAGRYTIRLSYLALGLVWSSDYIANVAPDSLTAIPGRT